MTGPLLSYSLAVCIVLVPLYLTVKLLMGGLTFHRLVRCVIVASMLLSLAAPLAVDLLGDIASPSVPSAAQVTAGMPVILAYDDPSPGSGTPLWLRVILMAYGAGTVAVTVRWLVGLVRLTVIIHRSRPVGEFDGWKVIASPSGRFSPFSFGRYIVVGPQPDAAADRNVLVHESAHLAGRHWIDLLLADILVIVCWYCPASWLMRRELAVTHEYEADEAVLSSGASAADYQIMLIKKAAGSRFPSIACNLTYHSNISKRIKMMLKQKSRPALRMAAVAALPAVALSLGVLSAPVVAHALSAVSEAKVTDNYPTVQVPAVTDAVTVVEPVAPAPAPAVAAAPEPEAAPVEAPSRPESARVAPAAPAVEEPSAPGVDDDDTAKVYEVVEVPPTYPGGEVALMHFVAQNLRYPVEAMKKNIQGRVIAQFVVLEDGSIGQSKILRSVDPLLDEEALRVVKLIKFEKPGYMMGKPVKVWYTLPFNFKLSDKTTPADSTAVGAKQPE